MSSRNMVKVLSTCKYFLYDESFSTYVINNIKGNGERGRGNSLVLVDSPPRSLQVSKQNLSVKG